MKNLNVSFGPYLVAVNRDGEKKGQAIQGHFFGTKRNLFWMGKIKPEHDGECQNIWHLREQTEKIFIFNYKVYKIY